MVMKEQLKEDIPEKKKNKTESLTGQTDQG